MWEDTGQRHQKWLEILPWKEAEGHTERGREGLRSRYEVKRCVSKHVSKRSSKPSSGDVEWAEGYTSQDQPAAGGRYLKPRDCMGHLGRGGTREGRGPGGGSRHVNTSEGRPHRRAQVRPASSSFFEEPPPQKPSGNCWGWFLLWRILLIQLKII